MDDCHMRREMDLRIFIWILLALSCLYLSSCDDNEETPGGPVTPEDPFYFGVDLSYLNQILDHNGVYKDQGAVRSPYRIFADNGANLVRLRLWHNPVWTKEVYGDDGTQLYNDLNDVEESIKAARQNGFEILLDFHYSDTWADPDSQEIPAAWLNIEDIEVLKDSVYNYTLKILTYLDDKGLMPEFVQIGNEINCGMLYTDAPSEFPACNACSGQWANLGKVINSAIEAVRDASDASTVKTQIILHVADPKNVEWWFDNIKGNGGVTDFDVVGFSYYPLWHTTVSIFNLSDNISNFKSRYGKQVMILETAYPWTTEGDDNYTNLLGGQSPIPGFDYTQLGQLELMKTMTMEVKQGGGYGLIYWEPDWITSDMKDLWGTGSSWENCALFDFNGDAVLGIDYMAFQYD